MFGLALQNLTSPPVLFFVLGLIAALVRADLSIPEAIAKFLAIYLLMSIGFRGGAEVAHSGPSLQLALALASGIALSFVTPLIAYACLRRISCLNPIDAAAVSAHYGSISAVTLVAAMGALNHLNISFEGFMVAVAAAMETPAIISALFIARGSLSAPASRQSHVFREIAFNGSVFVLIGAFAVGAISGDKGLLTIKPFILDVFPGLLSLFMLDMGLIAGRGLLQGWRKLSLPLMSFAWVMPLIGASLALPLSLAAGLSTGGTAILLTLAASSSYIAVPAAMRLALPEANAAVSLTLSLGMTFPFNLTIGIPLYIAVAQKFAG